MKKRASIHIDWKPSKKIKIPVYKQIVQFVCDKVSSGEWGIGTQLPPQRSMAENLGVNRSTISTAVDELTSFGIVEGRGSAGTVVVSNTWSLMLPASKNWNSRVKSGFFHSNNDTIQTINRMEFEEGIMRLGTGELDPRLFPARMFEEIMSGLSSRICSLNYLEPLGLYELREALSTYFADKGLKVPPSCILITSGSLQALHLISAGLLNSGTTVYTEAPTYLKSLQVFQSAGMRFSGIPMDENGLRIDKLEQQIKSGSSRKDAVLYTIPTNHNPTGITTPEPQREKLLDFCMRQQLPVIEDSAYEELFFYDAPPKTLSEMDKNGLVIHLGTTSKSLAPGLRVGWLIGPESIVQRLGDIKMQIDYGASSVSQWIFREFLFTGKYRSYVSHLRQVLKTRRDNALDVLDRCFGDIATWKRPEGGFYIWLTFRDNISMDELFSQAGRKKILLNPGDIYDYRQNNSLRLSYSYLNEKEFGYAADRLSQISRSLLH